MPGRLDEAAPASLNGSKATKKMTDIEDAEPDLPPAERLRTLAALHDPDPRAAPATSLEWPRALERHHAMVSELTLSTSVPAELAIGFETARNLYLYAWHVYRFYPVAEMQALVTLEAALRRRLPARLPEAYQLARQPTPMLQGLLSYAIDEGLIRNEGFRRWHLHAESHARQRRDLERLMTMIEQGLSELTLDPDEPVDIEPQDRAWDLVAHLRASLSRRRNAHAHGDAGLTNQVLGTIELVAEIMNQLFEQPGQSPAGQDVRHEHRLQAYVTQEVAAQVRDLARAEDRSESYICAKLLSEALAARKAPL